MYRLIVESLLGMKLDADKLHFAPCIPVDLKSFILHYRYRETFYHILSRGWGEGCIVSSVTVDGLAQEDMTVHLVDDRKEHNVEVRMG
jgi:cyclic beta-1,2-glucan synthetase